MQREDMKHPNSQFIQQIAKSQGSSLQIAKDTYQAWIVDSNANEKRGSLQEKQPARIMANAVMTQNWTSRDSEFENAREKNQIAGIQNEDMPKLNSGFEESPQIRRQDDRNADEVSAVTSPRLAISKNISRFDGMELIRLENSNSSQIPFDNKVQTLQNSAMIRHLNSKSNAQFSATDSNFNQHDIDGLTRHRMQTINPNQDTTNQPIKRVEKQVPNSTHRRVESYDCRIQESQIEEAIQKVPNQTKKQVYEYHHIFPDPPMGDNQVNTSHQSLSHFFPHPMHPSYNLMYVDPSSYQSMTLQGGDLKQVTTAYFFQPSFPTDDPSAYHEIITTKRNNSSDAKDRTTIAVQIMSKKVLDTTKDCLMAAGGSRHHSLKDGPTVNVQNKKKLTAFEQRKQRDFIKKTEIQTKIKQNQIKPTQNQLQLNSVKSQINPVVKNTIKTAKLVARPTTANKLVGIDLFKPSFPPAKLNYQQMPDRLAEQAYSSVYLNSSNQLCGQSEPSLDDAKNISHSKDLTLEENRKPEDSSHAILIREQEQIKEISNHVITKSKQQTRMPNENTGIFSLQSVESFKVDGVSSVKRSMASIGHDRNSSGSKHSKERRQNSKKYPLIHLKGQKEKIRKHETRGAASNQRILTQPSTTALQFPADHQNYKSKQNLTVKIVSIKGRDGSADRKRQPSRKYLLLNQSDLGAHRLLWNKSDYNQFEEKAIKSKRNSTITEMSHATTQNRKSINSRSAKIILANNQILNPDENSVNVGLANLGLSNQLSQRNGSHNQKYSHKRLVYSKSQPLYPGVPRSRPMSSISNRVIDSSDVLATYNVLQQIIDKPAIISAPPGTNTVHNKSGTKLDIKRRDMDTGISAAANSEGKVKKVAVYSNQHIACKPSGKEVHRPKSSNLEGNQVKPDLKSMFDHVIMSTQPQVSQEQLLVTANGINLQVYIKEPDPAKYAGINTEQMGSLQSVFPNKENKEESISGENSTVMFQRIVANEDQLFEEAQNEYYQQHLATKHTKGFTNIQPINLKRMLLRNNSAREYENQSQGIKADSKQNNGEVCEHKTPSVLTTVLNSQDEINQKHREIKDDNLNQREEGCTTNISQFRNQKRQKNPNNQNLGFSEVIDINAEVPTQQTVEAQQCPSPAQSRLSTVKQMLKDPTKALRFQNELIYKLPQKKAFIYNNTSKQYKKLDPVKNKQELRQRRLRLVSQNIRSSQRPLVQFDDPILRNDTDPVSGGPHLPSNFTRQGSNQISIKQQSKAFAIRKSLGLGDGCFNFEKQIKIVSASINEAKLANEAQNQMKPQMAIENQFLPMITFDRPEKSPRFMEGNVFITADITQTKQDDLTESQHKKTKSTLRPLSVNQYSDQKLAEDFCRQTFKKVRKLNDSDNEESIHSPVDNEVNQMLMNRFACSQADSILMQKQMIQNLKNLGDQEVLNQLKLFVHVGTAKQTRTESLVTIGSNIQQMLTEVPDCKASSSPNIDRVYGTQRIDNTYQSHGERAASLAAIGFSLQHNGMLVRNKDTQRPMTAKQIMSSQLLQKQSQKLSDLISHVSGINRGVSAKMLNMSQVNPHDLVESACDLGHSINEAIVRHKSQGQLPKQKAQLQYRSLKKDLKSILDNPFNSSKTQKKGQSEVRLEKPVQTFSNIDSYNPQTVYGGIMVPQAQNPFSKDRYDQRVKVIKKLEKNIRRRRITQLKY